MQWFLIGLMLGFYTLIPSVTQPDFCNRMGDVQVDADATVTDNCVVQGNLTVVGNATLDVDFSANPAALFVVFGDVTVKDDATLWVHGPPNDPVGAFVIVNEFNDHRHLMTHDNAVLRLEHIAFRTQLDEDPTAGSRYMSYTATDHSQMVVNGAVLDEITTWLLGNFHDNSRLIARNTRHVPTEIYVMDAAHVEVSGEATRTGLWLQAGSGDLDLPDQTEPYAWTVNRSAGIDVDWELQITDAQPGLGVQVMPGIILAISGQGHPATGELTIGYFVVGKTETLSHLQVGLQNTVVGDRLTLNNVHLGPFAWQIYVGDGGNLEINESVINEIGIFGNGHVTVNRSVLQLAVLAALGPGSTLDVEHSQVWNQEILAASDAQITLTNSDIHGSLIHARSPESSITIKGGSFQENPMDCTLPTGVDFVTGQPTCNPFRAPGSPTIMGPGTVTCDSVAGC